MIHKSNLRLYFPSNKKKSTNLQNKGIQFLLLVLFHMFSDMQNELSFD